jgi:hypothetical protein
MEGTRSALVSLDNAAKVTALLRVMVLQGDPPAELVARLEPIHAQVVEDGGRLRAALPAYLAQRPSWTRTVH